MMGFIHMVSVQSKANIALAAEFFMQKRIISNTGSYVNTCWITCRSANQRADVKRGHRVRNYSEYEKNPEVKARRLLWKQQHVEICRKLLENVSCQKNHDKSRGLSKAQCINTKQLSQ